MPDATGCAAACPSSAVYCVRCDVLVGIGGLHVVAVERCRDGVLLINVESPPGPVGCPGCGQVAESRGRKALVLVDAPIPHTTPEEMAQALNDHLGAHVREHLDQWFWIHKRWKG